ncbi:MAG TPA: alpha-L-glutamate ligase, partial [Myxococcota bacterium]|nr:alpha-L-glutamate ligase [Myxococcota bacterium]
AARQMKLPFITKHNQGGKGLGVQLFRSLDSFESYVTGELWEEPMDGVTLLQEYIEPPSRSITRVEIVDGRMIFAMRSATDGGFELCPADACQVGDAYCPVGETPAERFSVAPLTEDDPLVQDYIRFCKHHQIDVAGIEYVTGADGKRYTYDINMNTNYNSGVERAAGVDGMGAIAALAERALQQA